MQGASTSRLAPGGLLIEPDSERASASSTGDLPCRIVALKINEVYTKVGSRTLEPGKECILGKEVDIMGFLVIELVVLLVMHGSTQRHTLCGFQVGRSLSLRTRHLDYCSVSMHRHDLQVFHGQRNDLERSVAFCGLCQCHAQT